MSCSDCMKLKRPGIKFLFWVLDILIGNSIPRKLSYFFCDIYEILNLNAFGMYYIKIIFLNIRENFNSRYMVFIYYETKVKPSSERTASSNATEVQSNLFITDMLYNGHLVIADTFLRDRPNHGQSLIEKPLYSGYFYSGHFFWAPHEYFGQYLPLNSGHLIVGWENRKHIHVFAWHISLF